MCGSKLCSLSQSKAPISLPYFFQMVESLNMVLVVGLSVDYSVHLAEGYSRSAHFDRLSRTRDALREVKYLDSPHDTFYKKVYCGYEKLFWQGCCKGVPEGTEVH